jgi:hypothetical protein
MKTGISRWVGPLGLLGLFTGLGACEFNLTDLPIAPPGQPGRMDAGSHGDAGDARDGGDDGDAGGPGGDAGYDERGSSIFRHVSCSLAATDPRDPADIAVDATGRPLFDLYRDVACADAAEQPLCDDDDVCERTGFCLESEQGGGVCSGPGLDRQFILTLDAGRCFQRASLMARVQACCQALPGFDCRAWPYDRSSKPGELCARTRDCEPGLVCSPYLLEGFGLCVCPDGLATEVDDC